MAPHIKEPCSFCKTPSSKYFRSRDYNRNISKETFIHYRCPECNLIFISPLPDNLSDYYPNDYYYIPDSIDFLEAVTAHEQYKIDIIKQFIQHGRLLEIGPSIGSFAYLAKKSGFHTETIEIDARCSEYLNNVANIPTIHTSDAINALSLLKPFDVIALWHVIEHLVNPWKTLDAIFEKLNPGGILVLAAPNPEAFQFMIMGRYWPHVDAPRHITLIPAQLIISKLVAMGMTLELVTTSDAGGLGWNTFGWEYFFSNLSKHPRIKPLLRHIGLAIARLFSFMDGIEGKGCTYTVVLKKSKRAMHLTQVAPICSVPIHGNFKKTRRWG